MTSSGTIEELGRQVVLQAPVMRRVMADYLSLCFLPSHGLALAYYYSCGGLLGWTAACWAICLYARGRFTFSDVLLR